MEQTEPRHIPHQLIHLSGGSPHRKLRHRGSVDMYKRFKTIPENRGQKPGSDGSDGAEKNTSRVWTSRTCAGEIVDLSLWEE